MPKKKTAPAPTAKFAGRQVAHSTVPAQRPQPSRYLYSATILLSAFLLFLVQPVLAKVILPWFGGVASVWTVAILFFQGVLLLGYTYAYLSVRYLPPRAQALLHVALLAASVPLLPLAPWRVWQPGREGDPAVQILFVLLMCAGLPYFLLSTTGPLLQAWYARSQRVAFPYRLFALSNAGSLAALLAYPFSIEPYSTTRQQLLAWSVGYGGFAVVCCLAAVHFWLRHGEPLDQEPHSKATPAPLPGRRDYALWTMLAACGSALLVTVTNHICQNVLPIPLLWVLPLGVYLLTFILCFDRSGWYKPAYMRWLLPVALAFLFYKSLYPTLISGAVTEVALFLAALFVACLFCHGEMAHRKPPSGRLTSFYLSIALGGAVGSLAVALVAPRLSTWQVEFPETVLVCGLLAVSAWLAPGWLRRLSQGVLGVTLALLALGLLQVQFSGLTLLARSFYGSLSVRDDQLLHGLYHGTIRHGAQVRNSKYFGVPTTYYSEKSGVGIVLRQRAVPWRVGIVGLGTGTLAAYGMPGDSFQFYELDPLVKQLAQSEFSFLKLSRATVDVAIGDGRLLLNREPPGQFDLLVIDAFSGDAIPTHLLTREAFELYFRVLKPGGLLAVHITNGFLDLTPVLAAAAAEMNTPAVLMNNAWNATRYADAASWVLMGGDFNRIEALRRAGGLVLTATPGFRPWTDDYSSLLGLLR